MIGLVLKDNPGKENVDAAHALTRNDPGHIQIEALVSLLLRTKDWTVLDWN
jgi:hypothetical protein